MPQLKPEMWINYLVNTWWTMLITALNMTHITPPPRMPSPPKPKTTETPTWTWPW
uniref:ATPase subunit 8 n=1 Tax=Uromastyx benti TaxID=236742 RepID=D6RR63_9SAUR|nr:ATP synthase F0 subunit 8 [Uromastyx benti]BAJ08051.1 ATPase subunit 8 [Uromastyx benti]